MSQHSREIQSSMSLCCKKHTQHIRTKQCANSEKHTANIVKQHTINPLITPDGKPFLPSAISTVSVLFISTDQCIGVTGDVSDTKSVPSSVRMPAAVPL
ncbi:unnamed protein product [Staurois parvus]|uniref:Uncharacterized protein n=1 Tax=Staurois parvus TaxID=386267 RepID=A0ABN9E4V0_9NEOB|nr:unnamed protein product [Staurois parvus]